MPSISHFSTLAKTLSFALHPTFIPLAGSFIILHHFPGRIHGELIQKILLLIALGTYVLPFITSLIMFRAGSISSIMMQSAQDRKAPFIIGAAFYYLTAQLLKTIPSDPLLYQFILGASVTIFIHWVLLSYYKVSAHTAGIAGFAALLFVVAYKTGGLLSPHWVAACIVLCGIVGWARLCLKSHNLTEILIGYVTGSVPILFFTLV